MTEPTVEYMTNPLDFLEQVTDAVREQLMNELIVPLFKFDPCPRCGALHLLPLMAFTKPIVTGITEWPYYTACPRSGEPILICSNHSVDIP